jgi:hypothetical protein
LHFEGARLKKFLVKLSCFLTIQVVILILVLIYGQADVSSNHYLYAFRDKIRLLEDTPSPRIIFIGGSNLAFGLNSPLVKEELGFNPVNLGLHASIGIYPLLRAVEEHLREGDVIVLTPEYEVLMRNPQCRPKMAIEAYEVWPGCRRFVEPDLSKPLDELVPAKSRLRMIADCVRLVRKRLEACAKGEAPKTKSYCRNSFNQFGDHIAHYDNTSRYQGKYFLPGINEKQFDEVATRLNEFHQYCQSRGANVYFAHPPVQTACRARNEPWIQRLQKLLSQKISIPVITTIDMVCFDKDSFFDTDQHLTQQAATRRTSVICRQLRKYNVSTASVSDDRLR